MSLTSCARKAGDALSADDRAAVFAAAKQARDSGLEADPAALQAIDGLLEPLRAQEKEADAALARAQEKVLQLSAQAAERKKATDLLGEAPSEAQQAAAKLQGERAEKERAQQQAAPDADGFMLTGSERAVDVGAAAGQGDLLAAKPNPLAPAPKEALEAITDFGEKIGGARKDTATSTGPGRKRESDDRPTWAKRFQISQIVSPGGMIGGMKDEGRWIIRDSKSLDWMKQPKQVGRQTFATKEEAEAFLPLAAVAMKHRVVTTSGDKYEIWRDVSDRKRVKVVDRQFDSREDAQAYMAQHAAEILETNTTFGEADLPLPPDKRREGAPRRTGDVKGQDFMDAFGMRGVEFGNWNNQQERQALMNDAYDALMDLADVLGVPPKALSLNGDLALAFGARGHGLNSARAHYELERAVINLTKENGAGSLAHEWFHALDHYFGRQDGKASSEWVSQPDGTRTLKVREPEQDMASGGFGFKSQVRPELRAAYEAVMKAIAKKAATYVEDTAKADNFTARAREDLAGELDRLRRDLSTAQTWKSRNNKPASAEQLAEFDTIAQRLLQGEAQAVATDWRSVETAAKRIAHRWTNDNIEQLGAIFKAVRGRQGFDSANQNGPLDRVAQATRRYSERLKMLADAQAGTEKVKMQPTDFAMNAKELDQGRGGDYWTTPHEMAARAFQGYVEDKIAEQGNLSRFLNYAPQNAGILTPWGVKFPYPRGAERTAINQALQAFVDTIQTREGEDGGVAMFARGSVWKSELEDAISKAPMKAGPPQAWADYIKGLTTKGIKPDEVGWSGVLDWLALQDPKAKVPKEQVLQFLDQNGVQVQEVVKGGASEDNLQRAMDDLVVKLDAKGYTVDRSMLDEAYVIMRRRSDGSHWQVANYGGEVFQVGDDGGANTPVDPEREAYALDEEAAQLAMQLHEKATERERAGEYGIEPDGTRYGQYTLPGGENYREVLLTLPTRELQEFQAGVQKKLDAMSAEYDGLADKYKDEHGFVQWDKISHTDAVRMSDLRAEMGRLGSVPSGQSKEAPAYRSNHWDEPNILAHIRLTDRKTFDDQFVVRNKVSGNVSEPFATKEAAAQHMASLPASLKLEVKPVRTERRVLFVEEIQSDWAQAGRKHGFRQGAWKMPDGYGVQEVGPGNWVVRDRNGDPVGEGRTREAAIEDYRRLETGETQPNGTLGEAGVPSGPFVQSTSAWVNLALKRIIKMAADEGYDRVAFVTGKQTADRYNMRKHVSSVRFEDNHALGVGRASLEGPHTMGRFVAYGMDGRRVIDKQLIDAPKELADLIGQELADRLLAQSGRSERTEGGNESRVKELKGLDLEVGGEGHLAFYDNIVPKALDKLLPKFGGSKVGEVRLGKTPPKAEIDWGALRDDAKEMAKGNIGYDEFRNAHGLTEELAPDIELEALVNRDPYNTRRSAEIITDFITTLRQRVAAGKATKQPGFDVTPRMKELAADGMPLFSKPKAAAKDTAAADAARAKQAAEKVAKVRELVAAIERTWGGNGPRVHVVETPAQLPVPAPSDARGLLYASEVYVVASTQPGDLKRAVAMTLGHEAVAHYGLRAMLGREGWKQLMGNIQLAIASGNKPLTALRDVVRQDYRNADGTYTLSERQEADEIAAKVVENGVDRAGNFRPGFAFLKDVWSRVAQFLRKLGIDVKFTNLELQGMLVRAARHLQSGKRHDGSDGRTVVVYADSRPTFMYGGRKGAGVSTEGAAFSTLMEARDREQAGWTPHEIRQSTGWFRGKYDRKWRFELNDRDARLVGWGDVPESKLFGEAQTVKLGEVLEHPALYRAYPELRDVDVVKRSGFLDFGGLQGWFDGKNTIGITPYAKDPLSTILHEVQHWIQAREGFATGGNENMVWEALTPEQKARLAERMLPALEKKLQTAAHDRSIVGMALEYFEQPWVHDLERANKEWREYLQANPNNAGTPERMDAYKRLDAAEKAAYAKGGFTDRTTLTFDQRLAINKASLFAQDGREGLQRELDRADNRIAQLQQTIAGVRAGDEDKIKAAIEESGEGHNLYKAIAGEIEARDTQARQQLGPDERDATEPMSSEQYDPKDVIVTFGKDGESRSTDRPVRTVQVDGVRYPDTNSKGQVIHPTFQGQVNFWRWMRGSKVVDSVGRPLVVYHGTTGDVESFNLGFSGADGVGYTSPAIFATTDRRLASDYAVNKFDRAIAEAMRALQQFKNENPGTYDERYDAAYAAVKAAFRETAKEGRSETGGGANVMPLYMALQNPLVVEADGKRFMQVMPEAIAQAAAAGHDGLIVNNVRDHASPATDYPAQVVVAFKPEQIKSAVGNNGQFSPDDADIAFARGGTPQGNLFTVPTWTLPVNTRTDRFIYELQDGKVDLKRIQQAMEAAQLPIEERFDARLAETLFPGRVARRTENFLRTEAEPLVKLMARDKVTQPELSDFLLARHAPERNAVIARRNPNLPDGGAGSNSQGQLMTTAAAQAYLAAIPAARRAQLDALAAQVDAITARTRALLVAEGLETQETVDAWRTTMGDKYVPLFKDEGLEGMPHPTGRGFNVRGSSSKAATGSTEKVTNILAHVLMQREAAITRAEKNRVGLALYGLALTHPNPDFWTTIKPGMTNAAIGQELAAMGVNPSIAVAGMSFTPTIRGLDPVTGRVTDRPNPLYKSLAGALVLRVNGHDRVLMFNERNERAMRLAGNLKNDDTLTRMDIGASVVGKSTRWLAAVNTQYNPAFGLANLTRDTWGGLVNLGSTPLKGHKLEVIANIPLAMQGITRALWTNETSTSQWARLWQQFQDDGGRTGWRDMWARPDDRAQKIEQELRAMERAGKLTPRVVAGKLLGLLDGFNLVLENAVRLAAYKAALDNGMTRAAGAKLGRELTVDFNRKGRATRELSPLYAFFNANVQGTARIIETIKGPTGRSVVAGGLTLGVLQALLLLAADYDDDEIPEFVKTRSLIIPLPKKADGKKRFISIPYPLGLHILPNTGRVLAELGLNGGKNLGKKLTGALSEIVQAGNPLGSGNPFSAHGVLTTVLPTVGDPVADLATNRNFADQPIEREGYGGERDVRPGFQRAREGTQRTVTGQAYMDVSRIVNKVAGGSDYEAGFISPSPEKLRYITEVVGGGVVRELEKLIDVTHAKATGQPVRTNSVPIIGRFYGEVDDDRTQQSRYRDNALRIDQSQAALKAAIKGGNREEAEKIEARPELRAAQLQDQLQRELTQLNKLAVQTIGDPATVKEVDTRRVELMRKLNDTMAELERQRGLTPGQQLKGTVRKMVGPEPVPVQ